ncbi:hypothetical protein [uncultured Tenacibaculum sp.]|uniref:hypothetical protein n=1 Tax=uncultured Tenacibaculum sp. TaxID=174713 RepID=UPI00262C6906|nr:hypothetical protein [uncultured Tenacibaculum sp.]
MSWDLFIQDWGNVNSLDEIPDDFTPKPIGKRSEIINKMREVEPTIDFSDSSWGKLENDQFSIEFNMGDKEKLYGFTMHIRGNEMVIPCIANILSKLSLKAADGSNPNFFDVENSKNDIQKWITYRNKILNK